MEAATWAPSSTNVQPWRFIVVTQGEVIAGIAQAVSEKCQELSRRAGEMGEGELVTFFRFMRSYGAFFGDAAALIVACMVRYDVSHFNLNECTLVTMIQELGVTALEDMLSRTAEKSVAMAVQNLLLKAHELGYGSCVMDAPLIIEKELRQMLDIPQEHQVVMAIPLGVAAHQPRPPARKPLSDIMRYI